MDRVELSTQGFSIDLDYLIIRLRRMSGACARLLLGLTR